MHYRPHRGGLAEAMRECVELPNTMEALRQHIKKVNENVDSNTLIVAGYSGADERIGWKQTCVVSGTWSDGRFAVVGFTDAIPEGNVHKRNPNDIEQQIPEERMINAAIIAVEKLGAHPDLTETVNHLIEAQRSLAFWHDEGRQGEEKTDASI